MHSLGKEGDDEEAVIRGLSMDLVTSYDQLVAFRVRSCLINQMLD